MNESMVDTCLIGDMASSNTHRTFTFAQLLFAASPLIVLAYILLTAFEDPETEKLKRRKKGDFELEGHGD
jgi:hypothetical protein